VKGVEEVGFYPDKSKDDVEVMLRYFIWITNSLISGLLTPIGKTSLIALISKKPTKVVVKICVNSRCNRFYQNKLNDNPKKVLSMSLILVRDLKLKKFRTIRPNSVILARFLTFLLHPILKHIGGSEFGDCNINTLA
jgi:hypothetical protein